VEEQHESRGTINDLFLTQHPVPPVPAEYDSDYSPQFVMMVAFEQIEASDEQSAIFGETDAQVRKMTTRILIGGFVGLVPVMIVIFAVSLYLTMPLVWINEIGNKILQSFGSNVEEINISSMPWSYRYAPRTEISLLVEQFRRMVSKFSGQGTAKVFKRQHFEVKNPFELQGCFRSFYNTQRQDNNNTELLTYGSPITSDADTHDAEIPIIMHRNHHQTGGEAVRYNERVNWGPNIKSAETGTSRSSVISQLTMNRVGSRKLFWWIVGSITLPLIGTFFAITFYTVWMIQRSLLPLFEEVERTFVDIILVQGLPVFTMYRALYLSQATSNALSQLFVLNRMAGWLLFGALNTSTTFTSIVTAAEMCKEYSMHNPCPFIESTPIATCDCAWNDPWGKPCDIFPAGQSRLLQRVFFEGIRNDVFPNGDRNSTSYPDVGNLPDTTSFWDSATQVPGSENQYNASGYYNTYDRLTALSALSAIQIPLYNSEQDSRTTWGTYVGFEAGGVIGGYSGCQDSHAYYADFRSTDANGAAENNPDLCPLGKYG